MFSRSFALLVFCCVFALTACAGPRTLGEETWYQVDSDHFRIVTNGDPAAVKTLVADLERYRAVALSLFGEESTAGEKKLTIYATADRQSYAQLVGAELAEVTNGLYDTTADGSYALVNLDGRTGERQLKAREFLFHEYTHFLTYSGNTTHYPYWYSEGFAEFMSTMTFTADGRYRLGAVPRERAMTLLFTSPMPLEQLLRATVYNTSEEDKPRVYASGWMLAHWVLMESGKTDDFKEFVKAYNSGADPVEALEQSLGMTLADIDKQYQAMFESGHFDMVSGRIPTDFQEASPVATRLPQPRAVAEIANFIVQSGYNLESLYGLVQYARVRGVNSAELTAIQAEAESRIGNYQRAEQLLAQVPSSQRDTLWYKKVDAWLSLNGQVMLPNNSRDREQLQKARKQFVFLVNNDAETASHWFGLAMTMEMLGYPREKYVEMLEQAYLRAPRQVHIAQWLARELYMQKDAEYFTQVAQPLLLEMGSEEEYKEIKMMLAELQPKSQAKGKVHSGHAHTGG
ncbi:collagenase [Microbulbifer thermotolerans]|uniref:Collagenase n=1 Tax=Microbulbifer thermotolerans TaxID=252514 RepID=A0AB35HXA7_MICTH|nr:collagenase [Microbulbifer thermotolerans]MCX2801197.1 collagenase [Microbulbifer thermotolerans]